MHSHASKSLWEPELYGSATVNLKRGKQNNLRYLHEGWEEGVAFEICFYLVVSLIHIVRSWWGEVLLVLIR